MSKARSALNLLWVAGAGLLLAVAGVASYRLSERAGMAALSEEAHHRLDLFAAAIDSIVNRYAHIPVTLQLNPDVVELVRQSGESSLQAKVNIYLERLNSSIGSIAIYVMDREGVTLAASNWNRSDSFIGEDLSFRPYFQTAIKGKAGRYYAIGTTRGDPGYFVSHPIIERGQIIGVTVIKIGLGPLESAWLPPETPALIADANGVVILASFLEWRLKALAPLSLERAAEVLQARQYNDQPVEIFPVRLDLERNQSQVVTFARDAIPSGGGDFLALSRLLADSGWRLILFSDLRPVRAQAWNAAALGETATVCLLLALMFFNLRRRNIRQRLEAQAMLEQANASLELKVAQRTDDLLTANQRLRGEVSERKRAEKKLRAAQDETIQSAKLAVLGQLATGITHELTQPLAAIRTLSQNAIEFMQRNDYTTLKKNLEIVGGLVDRMGLIIEPLKAFGRKSPLVPQKVDVGQSVRNALFLLDQRLRSSGVSVDNRCQPGSLWAWCEPVRLEQVLLNLIGNGIDALEETDERRLILNAAPNSHGKIVIRVTDSGPGLPVAGQRIFEPFFTTKPAGRGLGLGLAISRDIVHDFGGTLTARSLSGGGAEFTVELPIPPAQG
jgi:two-component system C4-dicarboxylate transport sensor histidine kinase DctB